ADADQFLSELHPRGDGYWVGYTGAGCVPPDDQSWSAGSGETPFGKGNGAYMLRSAFNFLLTGDTAYANPVRTELLNQITVTGTNWANTSMWCITQLGTANAIEIIPWLMRLLVAYDYLNAGGYTGFSSSEKTNITQWFVNASTLWKNSWTNIVNFTHYPGIFAIPQDLSHSTTGITALLYFNGPSMDQATYNTFFNQPLNNVIFVMGVG